VFRRNSESDKILGRPMVNRDLCHNLWRVDRGYKRVFSYPGISRLNLPGYKRLLRESCSIKPQLTENSRINRRLSIRRGIEMKFKDPYRRTPKPEGSPGKHFDSDEICVHCMKQKPIPCLNTKNPEVCEQRT
jgi:hypothetical protein